VGFLVGFGRGGSALRAFAREAAVGANRPVEGVLGRAAEVWGVEEGVFARVVDVGALTGVVEGAFVEEAWILARDEVAVLAGMDVLGLV